MQCNYPVINGKLAPQWELFDKWIHAKDRHYIQGGYKLPDRNPVTFLPRFVKWSKKEEKQLAEFHSTRRWTNADLEGANYVPVNTWWHPKLKCLKDFYFFMFKHSPIVYHCWYFPRDYVQHCDVQRKAAYTHTHIHARARTNTFFGSVSFCIHCLVSIEIILTCK
jgi:hypothetical protein